MLPDRDPISSWLSDEDAIEARRQILDHFFPGPKCKHGVYQGDYCGECREAAKVAEAERILDEHRRAPARRAAEERERARLDMEAKHWLEEWTLRLEAARGITGRVVPKPIVPAEDARSGSTTPMFATIDRISVVVESMARQERIRVEDELPPDALATALYDTDGCSLWGVGALLHPIAVRVLHRHYSGKYVVRAPPLTRELLSPLSARATDVYHTSMAIGQTEFLADLSPR